MADVASALYSWSTTESSNFPTGATAISTGLDDNLRQIQATTRGWLAHKGADIASASTTDIGAVTGLFHDITGTTTITALGTVSAGIWKVLKFEGALTLTHNATSLILPGGANILTADGDMAMFTSEASGNWRCNWYTRANNLPLAAHPSLTEGRLTLTTATAITTSDVTAATTIYFTPYQGNRVSLYNGAYWQQYTFTELSIAVPATTVTMYDLFLYDNAGTLTLDATAWTNDTTRATALALQNGAYVKTGATGRKYLGSFRTTGVSGQTEDSITKRFVWNYHHRTRRPLRKTEATNSWTYTTNTVRQARADSTNLVEIITGVSDQLTAAEVRASAANSTGGMGAGVGVGLDSTTSSSAQIYGSGALSIANDVNTLHAYYSAYLAVGYHYLAWLEVSEATGTTTWYGDNGGSLVQSGIFGEVWA